MEQVALTNDRKLHVLREWMEAGNFWYSSMEHWLRAEYKGDQIPLEEIHVLVSLGLMERKRYGYRPEEFDVTRYRVSKHGKEWMRNPPVAGVAIRVKRREPAVPLVDCEQCLGAGVWEEDDCSACDGLGQVAQPAWCPTCEGDGVADGEDCARCNGTGEWRPRSATPISLPEKEAPVKRAVIKLKRRT